jgi:hypothetical protein
VGGGGRGPPTKINPSPSHPPKKIKNKKNKKNKKKFFLFLLTSFHFRNRTKILIVKTYIKKEG